METPKYDCMVELEQLTTITHQLIEEYGMIIWTVYDHPKDYPRFYTARAYSLQTALPFIVLDYDLEKIQEAMEQAGLHRLRREENDDENIIETWI